MEVRCYDLRWFPVLLIHVCCDYIVVDRYVVVMRWNSGGVDCWCVDCYVAVISTALFTHVGRSHGLHVYVHVTLLLQNLLLVTGCGLLLVRSLDLLRYFVHDEFGDGVRLHLLHYILFILLLSWHHVVVDLIQLIYDLLLLLLFTLICLTLLLLRCCWCCYDTVVGVCCCLITVWLHALQFVLVTIGVTFVTLPAPITFYRWRYVTLITLHVDLRCYRCYVDSHVDLICSHHVPHTFDLLRLRCSYVVLRFYVTVTHVVHPVYVVVVVVVGDLVDLPRCCCWFRTLFWFVTTLLPTLRFTLQCLRLLRFVVVVRYLLFTTNLFVVVVVVDYGNSNCWCCCCCCCYIVDLPFYVGDLPVTLLLRPIRWRYHTTTLPHVTHHVVTLRCWFYGVTLLLRYVVVGDYITLLWLRCYYLVNTIYGRYPYTRCCYDFTLEYYCWFRFVVDLRLLPCLFCWWFIRFVVDWFGGDTLLQWVLLLLLLIVVDCWWCSTFVDCCWLHLIVRWLLLVIDVTLRSVATFTAAHAWTHYCDLQLHTARCAFLRFTFGYRSRIWFDLHHTARWFGGLPRFPHVHTVTLRLRLRLVVALFYVYGYDLDTPVYRTFTLLRFTPRCRWCAFARSLPLPVPHTVTVYIHVWCLRRTHTLVTLRCDSRLPPHCHPERLFDSRLVTVDLVTRLFTRHCCWWR